jgi:hypothetical protein
MHLARVPTNGSTHIRVPRAVELPCIKPPHAVPPKPISSKQKATGPVLDADLLLYKSLDAPGVIITPSDKFSPLDSSSSAPANLVLKFDDITQKKDTNTELLETLIVL